MDGVIGGVYLAYPIDQRGPASLDYLFQQIQHLKETLISERLVSWVFDPGDAFSVNPRAEMDDTLPRINRHALLAADLVVAFLPAGVPTIGVPIEVDRARAAGKHVIVVSDAKAWMLEMPGIMRVGGWDEEHIVGIADQVHRLDPPIHERRIDPLPFVVHDGGRLPSRTYEDDAGLDLYVSRTTIIPENGFVDVPAGVSVELAHNQWGLITGRSSTLRKRGLLVNSGVIDAGYRGPLFAGVWNLGPKPVTVVEGERIAQLIIHYNSTRLVEPEAVKQLTPSERGDRGFGSSGN